MQRQKQAPDLSVRRALFHGAAIASAVVVALLLTNPYFNVLEDETIIISYAQTPVREVVRQIETGTLPCDHPPLSDLLLHLWLPVAGVNLMLIRLPFILCYGVALIILGFTARKLGGQSAFYTTMVLGAVWPFGFQFGRLAGWYSFCFLLVAILTFLYVRFLDAPGWGRWILVVAAGVVLISSNYFGWAILACMAVDLVCSLPWRKTAGFLSAGLAILIAGQIPLWLAFSHEFLDVGHAQGKAAVSQVLLGGFNVYSVFVSESVAPWFWIAGLTCLAAIAFVLMATVWLTRGRARRMFIGFFLLVAAMVTVQINTNKRMLFITGWFLVPLGCALANRLNPRGQRMLAAALSVIVVVGWFGIFARKYYAAPHFIEPWSTVAESAAQQVAEGRTVVGNDGPFLFDLNAALYHRGIISTDKAGSPSIPQVISLMYDPLPAAGVHGEATFVQGSSPFAEERTDGAELWFTSHCRLESRTEFFRDTGYELKKRFFPNDVFDPYRIRIENYDCGAGEHPAM